MVLCISKLNVQDQRVNTYDVVMIAHHNYDLVHFDRACSVPHSQFVINGCVATRSMISTFRAACD